MATTTQLIVTTALTQIFSGIFIGVGIAYGFYFALKRQMPKWIHEITQELRKIKAIENISEVRRKYS